MTHLIRTVSKVLIRTSKCLPSQNLRTVFSSAGIGLDAFKLSREQYWSRYSSSIESFKKNFLESVQKVDKQIFKEDLRSMILAAQTDEDILGIVEALKKYKESKLRLSEFNFGPPIMRLLYNLNKPDLAMKLFMDPMLKDSFQNVGSPLILMNKLIEDQRYDDALNIFEFACERGFTTSNGRKYPNDLVLLAVEALYKQNTRQSLEKTKDLLHRMIENNSDINPRTAAMAAILAIRQNEPAFAMELIAAVRMPNITTLRNIRAICYADMDRPDEAITIVHLLADQPPIDNDRRRVFPLVIEHIRKSVENTNDQDLKNRFEDISKFVQQNDRMSPIDLIEFINEPINRRTVMNSSHDPQPHNSFNHKERSKNIVRDTGAPQRFKRSLRY